MRPLQVKQKCPGPDVSIISCSYDNAHTGKPCMNSSVSKDIDSYLLYQACALNAIVTAFSGH